MFEILRAGPNLIFMYFIIISSVKSKRAFPSISWVLELKKDKVVERISFSKQANKKMKLTPFGFFYLVPLVLKGQKCIIIILKAVSLELSLEDGGSFKFIASVLSSQPVFEFGTRFALPVFHFPFLIVSRFPPPKKPPFRIFFPLKKFSFILSFFLYFDLARRSGPGVSCLSSYL